MNTMKYKGFIGSVSFSEKDAVFFGKVEGVNGLVNFEGDSVAELVSSFHEAVDDYIALCEETGMPLRKSYTGNLNIRIKPETHVRLAITASTKGISLNSLISATLDSAVSGM